MRHTKLAELYNTTYCWQQNPPPPPHHHPPPRRCITMQETASTLCMHAWASSHQIDWSIGIHFLNSQPRREEKQSLYRKNSGQMDYQTIKQIEPDGNSVVIDNSRGAEGEEKTSVESRERFVWMKGRKINNKYALANGTLYSLRWWISCLMDRNYNYDHNLKTLLSGHKVMRGMDGCTTYCTYVGCRNGLF